MYGVIASKTKRSYVKYKYLHPVDRERVVNGIVAKIRREGDFDGQVPNAISLHIAAARLTCLWAEAVIKDSASGAAYFSQNDTGTFVPLIITDAHTAQESPRYLRMFTHELAEHLQNEWVAPALFDADDVFVTDPSVDVWYERHLIAREVERILTVSVQDEENIS